MIARVAGSTVRRLSAALIASVLVLTVAGCGADAGSDVVVAPAVAGDLHIAPAAQGQVMAEVDRAIVVERRATVVSVDVVDGAPVQAGHVLLTVYTIGDSLAVATAVNTMRADAKELSSVRARDGVGAATTIALLARVAKDRQVLTDLKLSPTAVTAPVTGRVSGLTAAVGAELTRTDVVMHVIDDSNLLVTVPLAVQYRNVVETGQRAVVTLPGSGRTYKAAVVGIGPSATVKATAGVSTTNSDSTTDQTVPVTVKLTKPAGNVALGSTATVAFPSIHHAPVSVNSLAVLGSDQQPFVFVVKDGHLQQRTVVTGVTDGDATEILGGVTLNENVVISGGRQLLDGDPVSVTDPDRS